jgi:alkylresorcinol/alkylpyrone synthase
MVRPAAQFHRAQRSLHRTRDGVARAGGRALLDQAALTAAAIDALVVVSTTGMATPSLDALLIERMGLRRDTERLPVFGLGCAGGVSAWRARRSWRSAGPAHG